MAIDTKPKYLHGTVARGLQQDENGEALIEENGGRWRSGLIRGLAVITRGEALGHGMWIDQEFVESVALAMQAENAGTKSRYTHPDMSSDGLAKGLGRVMFVEGEDEIARGDLHFWKSARTSPDGDLAGHVIQRAIEDPTSFGTSISYMPDHEAETEFYSQHQEEYEAETRSGKKQKRTRFKSPDPENVNNYPHARLGELRAVDVVDDPAANPGGLFHRDGTFKEAESLMDYVMGATDTAPECVALGANPDRIRSFVNRYLSNRGIEMTDKPEDVKPDIDKPEAEPNEPATDTKEDFRNQLSRYVDTFGAEDGVKWFGEEKEWDACRAIQVENLHSKVDRLEQANAELATKLQAALSATGETEPVSTDPVVDDEPETKPKGQGFANRLRFNVSDN